MRALSLALMLASLSACATVDTREAERSRDVATLEMRLADARRADSLAALPSDSLTAEDARWLVDYTEPSADNLTPWRALLLAGMGLTVAGVVALFLSLPDE